MTKLLTHATLPDRTYASLGDTGHGPASAIGATTAAYAASGGRKGLKPTARFAIFDAGFAFGRTGWGMSRPFEDEVVWSARFGPGRAFHGHLDHGSVTLYGYGKRLVDDPGLFTLNNNRWGLRDQSVSAQRDHRRRSPFAGSTIASVSRATTARTHDDITIRDPGYAGVDLQRRVVFSHGLGWLLVDDRATSEQARTYRQLWHLLPVPIRTGSERRCEHGNAKEASPSSSSARLTGRGLSRAAAHRSRAGTRRPSTSASRRRPSRRHRPVGPPAT